MISLKSYLSRDTEAETAYRRIIGLFLQGISLHAVEGDKADHERFQEDIDKCLSVLSPKTPVSELLLVVGGGFGPWKITTSAPANLSTGKTQNCSICSPCSPRP